MRAVWPADKPMSVRISAHDWAPGGNTADDAVAIARLFKAAGADLIDVSSGQTTRDAQAGLRPHVPDAVRRSHPQRSRHRDDGGRRDLRARPRQQHPDGRARRSVRARRARISPIRTGRCTRRRSWATTTCRGRRNTCPARRSSSAISRAPRRWRTSIPRRTDECARRSAARAPDRESRLHDEHHEALRLWLRLLTCTLLIEGRVRARLRERFATTLPRFDLMAQLERNPEGPARWASCRGA